MEEKITKRLNFVMPGSGIGSVQLCGVSGDYLIRLDLHGMSVAMAKRTINNIIAIMRCPFHLEIIHGYNHGTSLLQMVRGEYRNSGLGKVYCPPANPGVTLMNIQ